MRNVMEVPCGGLRWHIAKLAFGCWHDVAKQTRKQKDLERQLSERESAQILLTSCRKAGW